MLDHVQIKVYTHHPQAGLTRSHFTFLDLPNPFHQHQNDDTPTFTQIRLTCLTAHSNRPLRSPPLLPVARRLSIFAFITVIKALADDTSRRHHRETRVIMSDTDAQLGRHKHETELSFHRVCGDSPDYRFARVTRIARSRDVMCRGVYYTGSGARNYFGGRI